MYCNDELTTDNNDYCFAKEGEIYALYLPQGRNTEIALLPGKYAVNWFDPAAGGDLRKSTVTSVSGGMTVSTGNPPGGSGKDWVCLIRRE
jgi:hypothetical protein